MTRIARESRFQAAARTAGLLIVMLANAGESAAQRPRGSFGEALEVLLHARGVLGPEDLDELRRARAGRRRRQALHESFTSSVDRLVESLVATDAASGRGVRFRTRDERFALRVGGRGTVRFTHEDFDGRGRSGERHRPEFRARSMRVRLDGHAFDRSLRFRLQVNLAGDAARVAGGRSANTLVETKDAWVEQEFTNALRLRVGQFRAPYGRQSFTGQARQQLTDRGIQSGVFGLGRDVGVMVHGDVTWNGTVFEYYGGVFDGEGENRTNDDEGLLAVVRVAVNPLGAVPYRESALASPRDFTVAWGINAWHHGDDGLADEGTSWSVGTDVVVVWDGVFALLEVHHLTVDAPATPRVEALGWLFQAGVMLVDRTLELALRFAEISWRGNASGPSASREHLVALNWFLRGHELKLQVDFGRVEDHFRDASGNSDSWRLRVQMQVIF